MSNMKAHFLAGTILSAVAIGSVHAAPLNGTLLLAQVPQSDDEKEKKPPQPSGEPLRSLQQQEAGSSLPPQLREVQPPPSRHREVRPPPLPSQQPEVQPPPPRHRE
jgi:hypothetical protein